MTIGDTGAIAQGVGAFASRQTVNAGCSAATIAGADGAHATHRARRARRSTSTKDDIDLDDGQTVATTGNNRRSVSANWRDWRKAFPALRCRRAGCRARTHGLLHAVAGRLLLRHSRREVEVDST